MGVQREKNGYRQKYGVCTCMGKVRVSSVAAGRIIFRKQQKILAIIRLM